ncbi:MAG: SRPBCC family protein [Sandaracinaceae bacterium]
MKRSTRAIAIAGGVFLTGVIGCVGGGYAIEPDVTYETARDMRARPEAVMAHLTSADGLRAWWAHADTSGGPPMTVRPRSARAGEGMVVTFEADGEVLETWTLERSAPDRVDYAVDFAGLFAVHRTLTVSTTPRGCRVTWRETGRVDDPLARWMLVATPPDEVVDNFDRALVALERAATSASDPIEAATP